MSDLKELKNRMHDLLEQLPKSDSYTSANLAKQVLELAKEIRREERAAKHQPGNSVATQT